MRRRSNAAFRFSLFALRHFAFESAHSLTVAVRIDTRARGGQHDGSFVTGPALGTLVPHFLHVRRLSSFQKASMVSRK